MLVTSSFSFPTMVPTLAKQEIIILAAFKLSSANAFSLVQSKILRFWKESVIILKFLIRGPTAQQYKNHGQYIYGHGTACHPRLKLILSILRPRRMHSLEASFLKKIKLTSIRFISFSYILVLYDCQISFSLKLVTVWHLRQEGLTFIPFIVRVQKFQNSYSSSCHLALVLLPFCTRPTKKDNSLALIKFFLARTSGFFGLCIVIFLSYKSEFFFVIIKYRF